MEGVLTLVPSKSCNLGGSANWFKFKRLKESEVNRARREGPEGACAIRQEVSIRPPKAGLRTSGGLGLG